MTSSPPSLRRILADRRDIHMAMWPRDAYTAVGLLQAARRQTGLAAQRMAAERIGRALQGALAQIAPDVGIHLEAGWELADDGPTPYEELREAIIAAFDPADDDIAEEAILERAVRAAGAELRRLRKESALMRQALAGANLEIEA